MKDPISTTSSEKTYYCPDCKQPLRRIQGKMGPFWGCTDFPKCGTTLNDVAEKPSQEIDEHYRCPICTRRLVRASKEKGDYWYCSGFSKGCKVTLPDKDGAPEPAYRCRSCGNLLVKRTRKDSDKKVFFWGCSDFPVCKTSYSNKNDKPDFDFLTTKNS